MDSFRSPPAEQPDLFDNAPLSRTQSVQSAQFDTEQNVPRSRNPSATNMRDQEYQKAQQPINKAVTQAFDKAEGQHGISPELLNQITSQITANVIQQLKTTNLNSQIGGQEAPPAPPNGTAVPASPSAHSTSSQPPALRDVYTPPTPHRPEDLSPGSSFTQSKASQPALDDNSIPERAPVSPISQSSPSSESPRKESQAELEARPKGPRRLSSGQNATLVERAWGSLYDENGAPTARLGQFLRGIANYLIENYEPPHSLVITPEKMQKFYKETTITSEIYPWQEIFDDRTSSISRLFRELGVVHHLVQEEGKYDERPDIPGLTPRGFQTWVTLLLQANPEQEFERLQRVVRDMPISNDDNRRDRFPKEITRRLFPAKGDSSVKEKLEKSLKTHCAVKLPAKATVELNGNSSHRRTETAIHQPDDAPITINGIERERQPYSGATSTASSSNAPSVVDEDEDTPTPQPIERERKPYSVNPSGSKMYNDSTKPPPPPAATQIATPHSNIPPPPPDSFKDPSRVRAYSTATSNRNDPTISGAGAGPMKSRPIPIVSNGRAAQSSAVPSPFDQNAINSSFNDQYTHPPPFHPRTGSIHRTRPSRNRSPSIHDPYRHSEPEFARPGSSYPDKPRERERDYDRGTYESNRMSMYEMGSSLPGGRERGRYRHEGGSGSMSSGTGVLNPPPASVKYPPPSMPTGGSFYGGGSDDERFRQNGQRPTPLGGTPGANYDHGTSSGTYYR